MATKIYESGFIELIDGTILHITPLKIVYLRDFMDEFSNFGKAQSEEETMDILLICGAIAMKQYYPEIATKEILEDSIDMDTLYDLLDFSAGIQLKNKEETTDTPQKQVSDNPPTWETMDLAALESEAFLLGIWKGYEELEHSLSLPELMSTLNAKRDADYAEKKFLAAIQGVDLDEQSGKSDEPNAWEAMKARVFSGGATSDPNDVLALQGTNAQKAGFGIGMGLGYETWDE
jgi:hypothetical protein